MLPAQRREWLVKQVNLTGQVVVSELADRLGVSRVTLRRDLEALEKAGRLARVHGGAVPPGNPRATTARLRIGVMVPQLKFYFTTMIAGMQAAAERANAQVIFGAHEYDPEIESTRLRRLLELEPDALLFTSGFEHPSDPDIYATLSRLDIPVVVLERHVRRPMAEHAQLSSVRTDHVDGAALAMEHLFTLGHRDVACFVSPTMTGQQLFVGADQAARRWWGQDDARVHQVRIGEGEEVDRQARELLSIGRTRPGRPITAVLGHADRHTIRLVDVALAMGIDVPRELSVISYDDVFATEGTRPLSAMAPPKHWVGRLGLEMAVAQLHDANEPVREVLVSPTLVDRGTTGPAPG